jgi:hypothetical protein
MAMTLSPPLRVPRDQLSSSCYASKMTMGRGERITLISGTPTLKADFAGGNRRPAGRVNSVVSSPSCQAKINKVSKMDSHECRSPQPGECFAVQEQLIKCGSLGLLLLQEPGAGDGLITFLQDMVQLWFVH